MNFTNSNFKVELEEGLIKDLYYNDTRVNLLSPSKNEERIFNLYVRIDNELISLYKNVKKCSVYSNGLEYEGNIEDDTFKITLVFKEYKCFIDVEMQSNYDIIYTQDIGIGDEGYISGTLYSSQYIDNRVYDNCICYRRTIEQSAGFTAIQVGSFNEIDSYVTDGIDFYSLNYKLSKKIQNHELTSRERNDELSFAALEVKNVKKSSFYFIVKENVENQLTSKLEDVKKEDSFLENKIEEIEISQIKIGYINGCDYSNEELKQKYNSIQTIEEVNNKIYSFFTNEHAHVVTKEKEINTRRMHANIITSGKKLSVDEKVIVSSNYMNGMFCGQLAFGNTQQTAAMTNITDPLDLKRFSGLRILVEIDGSLKQLNVPSIYEVGFNYSKWIYKLEDNCIEVISYTSLKDNVLYFEINTEKEIKKFITFTHENNFEYIENKLVVKNGTLVSEKLPDLSYKFEFEGNTTSKGYDNYVVLSLEGNSLKIVPSVNNVYVNKNVEFTESKLQFNTFINEFSRGLKLSIDGELSEEIKGFNHLIYWYIHNALIHYATPHGVEQRGGAAWGTRDVCQGPIELFSTFGHYEIVKEIILKVFENQYMETGNWPQWFMFDEFSEIRLEESHGDIIVWPLKVIGDYLNQTNDTSILEEKLKYFSIEQNDYTTEKYTLMQHIKKEYKYINDNYLNNTVLSAYSEGDWDDTLQPANENLRKFMSSGWTVALTYQAFINLSKALKTYDEQFSTELNDVAQEIKEQYNKYFIKDGVVSGFIYKDNDELINMLHPSDETTGIKYRLLPMNRCMISGLFTKEQTESHLQLIDEHLKCPDGIRLMDHPARYKGGVSEIFQRAESASTVGREISLQYVHAHIRYIEAMCKIGKIDRAYEGLKIISPVRNKEYVKNCDVRQANSYYSSSEGDFDNRYDYAKDFNLLRNGDIKVKSGWRIYSSGPGIYLNQLITSFLGINFNEENFTINDNVSSVLNGLNIEYIENGENKKIIIEK